jgi:hypothetical protein
MPLVNTVKAGSAVPVKFGLGGDRGMSVFAPGYPASAATTCGTNATDAVEQTVSPGASTLSYDTGTATYTYVWKTAKEWTGCRTLVVRFRDGGVKTAGFRFTK